MTQRRSVAARLSLGLGVMLLATLALAGCGGSTGATDVSTMPAPTQSSASTERVTFVELGSDSCVPCKEMRPVMDGIQKAFGDQVEIVFYDVWEDQAPAREYGVQMIPTQVFLDESGEEFHRHVGFYPQAEIEALLVQHGLTKLSTE
jgi:thioredoxin 1